MPGSEDEAWTDRTQGEMKIKRQCGPKEEQEGVDQNGMTTEIRRRLTMNDHEKMRHDNRIKRCKDFSV